MPSHLLPRAEQPLRPSLVVRLLALVVRLFIIKVRHPWATFIELVLPLLAAAALLVPRHLWVKQYFPRRFWTEPPAAAAQDEAASPPTPNLAPDYTQCPFGLYGPLIKGPFTHSILEAGNVSSSEELKKILALFSPQPDNDVSPLFCWPARSPLAVSPRMLLTNGRALDGRKLAFLPVLNWRFGEIVFVGEDELHSGGSAISSADSEGCNNSECPSLPKEVKEKMKSSWLDVLRRLAPLSQPNVFAAHYDTFVRMVNPWVWSAVALSDASPGPRKSGSDFNKDGANDDFPHWTHGLDWEHMEIVALYEQLGGRTLESDDGPRLNYTLDLPGGLFATSFRQEFVRKYPKFARAIAERVRYSYPSFEGVARETWTRAAPQLWRLHQLDEAAVGRKGEVTDWSFLRDSAVYSVVRTSLSEEGTGLDLPSAVISMSTGSGFGPSTKGSLFQYSLKQSAYDAQPISDYYYGSIDLGRLVTGGFLDLQTLYYSAVYNLTGLRPISLVGGSVSPAGDDGECFSECMDRHYNGSNFCNPACQRVYTQTDGITPLVRWKDARLATFIQLACYRMPSLDYSSASMCRRLFLHLGCQSCRRIQRGKLEAFVRELLQLAALGVDGPTIVVTFWEMAFSALEDNPPTYGSPDPADILACISSLVWASHASDGVDLMWWLTGNPSFVPSEAEMPALLRQHLSVTFDKSCYAADVEMLYTLHYEFAESVTTHVPAGEFSSFAWQHYFLAQIISGQWVGLKTKSATDRYLPLLVAESGMPMPGTIYDEYAAMWISAAGWGLVTTCLYIFVIYCMVKAVMIDKEKGISELLKIMGVDSPLIWMSVQVFHVLYLLPFSLLMSWILSANYPGTPFLHVWMLNFLFLEAALSFVYFMASTLGNKTSVTTTANITVLLFALTCIPQFAVSLPDVPAPAIAWKYLILCFVSGAYAYGSSILMALEIADQRLDGGSQRVEDRLTNKFDGVCLRDVLIALILATAVWSVLGLYFDQIVTRKGAVGRSPLFPLDSLRSLLRRLFYPSYPPVRRQTSDSSWVSVGGSTAGGVIPSSFVDVRGFPESTVFGNRDSANDEVLLEARNLIKVFPAKPGFGSSPCGCCGGSPRCPTKSKCRVVVDNLSFQLHRGEILAVLGHNGAGKSTTIHMLTGRLTPTSGVVRVCGHNMATETAQCRTHIGFCPQQDILLEELTLEELLRFYARTKGVPPKDIQAAILHVMQRLNLTAKRHTLVGRLSGGQKRAASVGVALLGGSEVVFLDEPTSGVDPFSRRFLWEALQEEKEDRVIVLTTHFIEEAEFLGDRVAIIHQGQLKCLGSPYYLKSKLGLGYNLSLKQAPGHELTHMQALSQLILDVEEHKDANDDAAEKRRPDGKSDRALEASKCWPGKTIHSKKQLPSKLDGTLREWQTFIPFEAASSLPFILKELEEHPSKYGIEALTISMILLEDIFLKIDEMEHATGAPDADALEDTRGDRRDCSPFVLDEDIFAQASHLTAAERLPSSLQRNWRLLKALLIKRYYVVRACLWGTVASILLPALFVFITFFLMLALLSSFQPSVAFNAMPIQRYRYQHLTPSPVVVGQGRTAHRFERSSEERNTVGKQVGDEVVSNVAWFRNASMDPKQVSGSLRSLLSADQSVWVTFPSDLANVSSFERALLDSGNIMTCEASSDNWCSPSPKFISFHTDTAQLNETMLQPPLPLPSTFDLDAYLSRNLYPPPLAAAWLFHNSSYRHSFPLAYNVLASSVLFSSALEKESDLENRSFLLPVANQPLPANSPLDKAGLLICLGVAPVVAAWGQYSTSERLSGAKQAQHLGGAPVILYWLAMFLWDILLYLPLVALCLVILLGCNIRDVVDSGTAALFFLLMTAFGAAAAPAASLITSRTRSPPVAQAVLIFLCVSFPLLVYTAEALPQLEPIYKQHFRWPLVIVIPAVTFLDALSRIADYTYDPTKHRSKVFRSHTGILLAQSAVYFAVLCASDYAKVNSPQIAAWRDHFCRRRRHPHPTDPVAECDRGSLEKEPFEGVSLDTGNCGNAKALPPIHESATLPSSRASYSIDSHCRHRGTRTDRSENSTTLQRRSTFAGSVPQWHVAASPVPLTRNTRDERRQLWNTGDSTTSSLQDDSSQEQLTVDGGDKAGVASEDVLAEQRRILAQAMVLPPDEQDVLQVRGLRKVFKRGWCLPPSRKKEQTYVAVDNLWFGIRKGECFGFLGANGAGKTTSINMMTGALSPTTGTVLLDGHDIKTDFFAARKTFGYCPQFEGLLGSLTGRQHIELFSRLALLPASLVQPFGEAVVQTVGLTQWADNRAETYSGGNRKKLAFAIACIGDPAVLFLDEPTSGVDPRSRRKLWHLIELMFRENRRAVLLTSHLMQEVESLCDRICIMAHSKMVCLGAPQRLRQAFSCYCYVEADFTKTTDLEGFASAVSTRFCTAHLSEQVGMHVKWRIDNRVTKLYEIFGFMEEFKMTAPIQSYVVSTTSLEQFFIDFCHIDRALRMH